MKEPSKPSTDRTSWRYIGNLCAMVFFSCAVPLIAQPVDVTPTWEGDLLDRPRLTGTSGGVGDDLATKGLVLDADLTVTPQSVWAGGRQGGTGVWGYATYTLNLDTGELSLTALDPSGTVVDNGVSQAFKSGITLLVGGKITVRPFGLMGHQSLTGMWSNKERISLTQDPFNAAQPLTIGTDPLLGAPGLPEILNGLSASSSILAPPDRRSGGITGVNIA